MMSLGNAIETAAGESAAAEIRETGKIPMPRYAHAACEHGQRLWLFGGIVGTQPHEAHCSHDLHVAHVAPSAWPSRRTSWLLDWSMPTPQGTPPSAGFGHSLTRVGDALWTFGGRSMREGGGGRGGGPHAASGLVRRPPLDRADRARWRAIHGAASDGLSGRS